MSLAWRLTALVGAAFVLTAVGTFWLMDGTARGLLLQRNLDLRTQQLEVALGLFEQDDAGLSEDALPAMVLLELDRLHRREPEVLSFVWDRSEQFLSSRPLAPDQRRHLLASLQPLRTATSGDRFEYRDAAGRRQWIIFELSPDGDWVIGTSTPQQWLVSDAIDIRQRLVMVWVAVTVIMLVSLAVMLRREMRPLRALTRAADAMADGDLQLAIPEDGPGDVGLLARGFAHTREVIGEQLGALRESEARYRQIFDAMADGLLLVDQEGMIAAANPQVARTYGWTPAQLTGRPLTCLLREGDQELAQALRSPPADRPLTLSGQTCDREGRERETEIRAMRLTFQGQPHSLIVLHDITNQRRLEHQLLQSQRLESVGRLAGGIAHDFNNLLTPVLGYSEMLLASPDLDAEARADVEAIQRAGERARNLARQLLAFSHRQTLAMQDLDLSQTLLDFEPILRRTLREDIELVCEGKPGGCQIQADPVQIEQLLMNLAVNAMDAMPTGGSLELSVINRALPDPDDPDTAQLPSGTYCCLCVRDTGPGIPPTIIDHVCEPFFTTKDHGKGLGLGLATVQGIVRQHGGKLNIRNLDGSGCEVMVFLPCKQSFADRTGNEPVLDADHKTGSGEAIILVEDDLMVRQLIETLLRKFGYAVRSYGTGQECLDDLLASPTPADLLLTDVVMPGMNGPELRDRLLAAGFKLPVVFMSGYAGETLIQRGLNDAHADFLQKPLTPERLLKQLRQMLARSPQPPASG